MKPEPPAHVFATVEVKPGQTGACCQRCYICLPVGAYFRLPDCKEPTS